MVIALKKDFVSMLDFFKQNKTKPNKNFLTK